MADGGKPLVSILTWCGDMAALYGAVLTFKTLRVGFPTARAIVTDNASTPEARPHIRAAAEAAGCEYRQLETPATWNEYYSWALGHAVHDTVILADPDLVFWENMEDLRPSGLFAGRLIPASREGGTAARLHPSLLFVPSAQALRSVVAGVVYAHGFGYYQFSPFEPTMGFADGRLIRWDTWAQMYQAAGEDAQAFTEDELDCYDHLYCGTHLDAMRKGASVPVIEKAHALAKAGDLAALRGIWREQEAYFAGGVQ